LEQALQLEPDYREALNLLANVYSQAGRAEDAGKQLGLFEQAAARKRRHYADPLVDELDELKAGDVLTLFEDGLALQNAGDLRQALARYNEVLEIDPDYEQAHVSLIAVHAMLGAPRQAVLHFERALAINPNLKEAHYNLGLMRHREGNFAEAADAFSKALEINPTDAETLGSLGVALEQLGRGSAADEHFRSALRHDPANPTANFHMGRRLAERGRHREALPYLRRALETKAEPPPVQVFFLALVYRQLGNQEQAREYGQRALEQARSTGQTELAAQITAQLDL
jgi:tetratricopeptide (TPR) repeat protein